MTRPAKNEAIPTMDRRHAAWHQCLRSRARLLEQVPELERRRVALMEGVSQRSGVRTSVLGQAYDLALEVGLDPVLALEIVGCGVAVLELPAAEPEENVSSPQPPAWVAPPLLPPDRLLLERRMRLTFRRMRTALEEHPDLDQAVAAFCAAPDVGPASYEDPLD
jgi:hypothetical protein